jgi:hypothetical protein
MGDAVDSVDGEPVNDARSLDRVFRRMPELAPDVMTVRRGTLAERMSQGYLPSVVEIRYVSQEVLRQIERSLNDEHLFDDAAELPSGWQHMPGMKTIVVGTRYRSWALGRSDADSQRLDDDAARIASIAKTSRHVVPESPLLFERRDVGNVLKRVAFIEGRRSIELSHIDWIEASTRTPAKITAGSTEAVT